MTVATRDANTAPVSDVQHASEWRRGWRVVLGGALAAATGVNLLYYVFSLFIPYLQAETSWTLGEFSRLQALVGVGSLAAPAVGWAMDRWGFRRVYAIGMALLGAFYILLAAIPLVPALFGVTVFVTGLVGLMTTSIAYTRAVSGWFLQHRGFALALTATGLSASAVLFPPLFERILALEGWRGGYVALGVLALSIGLPAILLLIREEPSALTAASEPGAGQTRFLGSPAFWLLCVALMGVNLPGSGMLSQMAPMLIEEGLTIGQAAIGISTFAVGQVVGRLGCGWCLDRFDPPRVGFLFTLVPAIGAALLWGTDGSLWVALFAVAAVGVQQGAEIDLLAFFVARRFGLARYGSIYGWLQAAGWAATIGGILLFGQVHDWTGNYAAFHFGAIFAYLAAAFAVLFIKLPPKSPTAS